MNNRIKSIIKAAVAVMGFLAAGQVHAALVAYENVKVIQGTGYFTDTFTIGTAGTYKATLTDFDFPSQFNQLSLDVMTAKESMGTLSGSGSFLFDAKEGTYYAVLAGLADGPLNLGAFGVQIESIAAAAPVPVPAAIILLVSGLCVLLQMAWRRRGEFDHDAFVTKGSYSSVTV